MGEATEPDGVLWGEEHIDYAPLRTVFPDHDDLKWWHWLEAMRSPDNGVIAHAYKLPFVGVLWVDHGGRIYRYHHPTGPLLLPADQRIALLLELIRLMEEMPEDLPRLVRLVRPGTDAEALQAPLEVKRTDDACEGCRKEAAARRPSP